MENTTTTVVELTKSSRVGQITLVNSARTSLRKVLIFSHIPVSLSPEPRITCPDYLHSRNLTSWQGKCRPGRTRTCNPRFWRPVLYQIELQTYNSRCTP